MFFKNEAKCEVFEESLDVACSRLRDSRVSEIEEARSPFFACSFNYASSLVSERTGYLIFNGVVGFNG